MESTIAQAPALPSSEPALQPTYAPDAFVAEPALAGKGETAKGQRYAWLDSFRGVCCLLVLTLHFTHNGLSALAGKIMPQSEIAKQAVIKSTLELYQATPFWGSIAPITDYIFGFWDLAKIGVIGFFLLSGYLIPDSLLKYKNKPLLSFAISRAFRLYPVYWISLALCLSAGALGLVEITHNWTVGIVLANLTMFHKYFFIPDVNGVAWTLQMELGFYALCMLLFATGRLTQVKTLHGLLYGFWGCALLLALGRFITEKALPVAFPLRMAYMMLGYLFRLASQQREGYSLSQFNRHLIWQIPLLGLICWLAYQPYHWTYFNSYMLGPLLWLGFFSFKWHATALSKMGQCSYSLYLTHPVVGFSLIPFLVQLMPLSLFQQNVWWLSAPIAIAACVAIGLAAILRHLVEVPFIQQSRRLVQFLQK